MNKYIDPILNIFKRKTDTVIDVDIINPIKLNDGIQEGAIYRLYVESTPVDCYCKVKQVREGWVLYAILGFDLREGGMFQNETMKVGTFKDIYKRANL